MKKFSIVVLVLALAMIFASCERSVIPVSPDQMKSEISLSVQAKSQTEVGLEWSSATLVNVCRDGKILTVSNAGTYIDAGLEPGVSYSYRVNCESAESKTITVQTDGPTPGQPKIQQVALGTQVRTVVVKWLPGSPATSTHFYVYDQNWQVVAMVASSATSAQFQVSPGTYQFRVAGFEEIQGRKMGGYLGTASDPSSPVVIQ